MESLKNAIEQALPGLETAALDLTFRQVIDLATGLDSTLESYKNAMQPYYRVTRKSRTQPGQGSSYYQRRREREDNVTNLAKEAIEKQGYVIAASLVSESGYQEQSVMKIVEQLASQQGWEKKRDRETKSYRYAPRPSPLPESPAAESTA